MNSHTQREALYQTIHQNKKPLKAIAEEIGMTANHLTKAALPEPDEQEGGSGCSFPLRKLIPLIRATGDFSVLDQTEQSLGRVAFKLPECAASQDRIYRLTMKSVKEFGELMAQLDAGMADGFLTPQEIKRINKEGYEAIQAIAVLLKNIEQE
jgi:hypothetical protein